MRKTLLFAAFAAIVIFSASCEKSDPVIPSKVPDWYKVEDKTDGGYDIDVDGGVIDRYDLDVN